jgi:hypothetical protein
MSQGKRVTQRSQLHEFVTAKMMCKMRDHLRFVRTRWGRKGTHVSQCVWVILYAHAYPGHEANVVYARFLHDVVDGAADGS